MALDFSTQDKVKADLEAKHPGWRVWYVPGIGETTWCAQKLPQVAEASPEDLSKAIEEAETGWRDELADLRRTGPPPRRLTGHSSS